jgi:transposase
MRNGRGFRRCFRVRRATLDAPTGRAVLADKAYDSNALRAIIAASGATAVIPSNRTRKVIIPHDATAYKQRNRIERCFCRLKHPPNTTGEQILQGFIKLAAAMIWMRSMSIGSRASISLPAIGTIPGVGMLRNVI